MSGELGRRLREADRAQRVALPRWQELLHRALERDRGGAPTGDGLARLLGVPTRRDVLRIGGLGIAGAAVLAACGDDDDGGDDALTDRTTTSLPDPDVLEPGADADVVLVNTAVSLEVLAIDAYRNMGELGLVESSAVTDAIGLFATHHAEHRDALVSIVEAAGGEPFTTPNPVVRVAFVDPGLAGATSQGDVVRLAHDLERAAAQTYVWATGTLSTAELRGAAISIGAVESRHAAILDSLGELANEQPSRYPTSNPLPSDALVES